MAYVNDISVSVFFRSLKSFVFTKKRKEKKIETPENVKISNITPISSYV